MDLVLSQANPGQKLKPSLYVRFEVFTAVTMKNCVFWDVMPCGSCKNRPILVTLIKEALSSSETSVLNRATRRNIPEDTILPIYLIHFNTISQPRPVSPRSVSYPKLFYEFIVCRLCCVSHTHHSLILSSFFVGEFDF
jgi:hypothetical protein